MSNLLHSVHRGQGHHGAELAHAQWRRGGVGQGATENLQPAPVTQPLNYPHLWTENYLRYEPGLRSQGRGGNPRLSKIKHC